MSVPLTALLALVDDPNEIVAKEVTQALEKIPDLKARLEALEPSLAQRIALQEKLARKSERDLIGSWLDWAEENEPHKRLELGLEALSEYQSGYLFPSRLSQLLDWIARDFLKSDFSAHPVGLARYLFSERLGPDRENYESPENSNLVEVWFRGRGIPISLTCIYVLVAHRLSLAVEWCNYPGHFLARIHHEGKVNYVDCFEHGALLDGMLTAQLRGRVPLHRLRSTLAEKASPEQVLQRVLRNLINAYQHQNSVEQANLMRFLLKLTELGEKDLRPPLFQPGELVTDEKAGYRGVVVDYDLKFRPRFSSSQSDPEPAPYYLILVDRSSAISYSRESRLSPDPTGEEVRHPFLPYFFSGFEDGAYRRNNLPWPS